MTKLYYDGRELIVPGGEKITDLDIVAKLCDTWSYLMTGYAIVLILLIIVKFYLYRKMTKNEAFRAIFWDSYQKYDDLVDITVLMFLVMNLLVVGWRVIG